MVQIAPRLSPCYVAFVRALAARYGFDDGASAFRLIVEVVAGYPQPPVFVYSVSSTPRLDDFDLVGREVCRKLGALTPRLNAPLPRSGDAYLAGLVEGFRKQIDLLFVELRRLCGDMAAVEGELLAGATFNVDAVKAAAVTFAATLEETSKEKDVKKSAISALGLTDPKRVEYENDCKKIHAYKVAKKAFEKAGLIEAQPESIEAVSFIPTPIYLSKVSKHIAPNALSGSDENKTASMCVFLTRAQDQEIRAIKRNFGCRSYACALEVAIDLYAALEKLPPVSVRCAAEPALERFVRRCWQMETLIEAAQSRLCATVGELDTEGCNRVEQWKAFLSEQLPLIKAHNTRVRLVRNLLLASAKVDHGVMRSAMTSWSTTLASNVARKMARQEMLHQRLHQAVELDRLLQCVGIISNESRRGSSYSRQLP